MDIAAIAERVDARVAQSFVRAAFNVLTAMTAEVTRAKPARPPGQRDYNAAGLSREGPAGGWISDSELRAATQRISEAITTEKWGEGFMFALQAIAMLRP